MPWTDFPWSLFFVLATLLLATVISFLLVVVAGVAPPWSEYKSLTPESQALAARQAAALRDKLDRPIAVERGCGPSTCLLHALK